MKRPFKIIFATGTLMNRLLRRYAIFMMLLTTLSTGLIGVYSYVQTRNKVEMTLQEAIQSTTRMLNDKRSSSRLILNQLTGSYDRIENVTAYLTKPIGEYFNYIYSHQSDSQDFFLLPDELRTVYANYDDLSALYLSLSQFPEYLESTLANKPGVIKQGTPTLREDAFYIMLPILQGSANGSLFIGFQESDFEASLENMNSLDGLSVYVVSGTSNLLYAYHDARLDPSKAEEQEQVLIQQLQRDSQLPSSALSAAYYVDSYRLGGDYRIFVTLDKAAVWKSFAINMLPLVVGAVLLNAALLGVLFRTFKRYSEQVETVNAAMELAAAGRLDTRIDTQKTEFELRNLSEGINRMLNSIEQYVDDIYKLEIKQQEAHMRALQAQINPHFLYNTLEYIRMYALSKEQDELADVVYAFSTLLRNNISPAKVTTLKEELDFCEKYVYLYQMRYPNRIAYHFTIADELANLVIPKFVIQPIIENYFKHGIDFMRKNNVISIKVYQADELICIEIRDNGKGMNPERLAEITERLKNPRVDLNESIGMQNVNERMRGFYGNKYEMKLLNNDAGGLTVLLLIEKEDARV